MAKTKAGRDPAKNRANVARHRERALEVIDHLLGDVDIVPERRDGKWFITYDMGVDTAAALEVLAQAQGKSLDQLMRAGLARSITADRKLTELKAGYTGGE